MPDPSGFLKYGREVPKSRPVPVRITDWREVYHRADDQLINQQATRCMNCGIPFCHQGCPLGNLIPTWNDLVSSQRWDDASEMLHATNNFPEFTGRLCPAPCEGACVLGIGDNPVTIKQVEVEIINRVVDRGPLTPFPMATPSGKKVAVVGSGPAGLAAAQQLARAGHAVTLYERSDEIGGLLRYGIPDFKLEKHHIDRRLEQMAAEGVTFVTGCHVGVDIKASQLREENDAVLLTCGALDPRDVQETPGRSSMASIWPWTTWRAPTASSRAPSTRPRSPPTASTSSSSAAATRRPTAWVRPTGTVRRRVHLIEVMPEPPAARDSLRNPWPTWPVILRTGTAHEEGGTRMFGAAVQEFLGTPEGALRAVRVIDVEIQTQGGFKVVELPGTERELPADLVLLAIGFGGTEPGPHLAQLGLERGPARHHPGRRELADRRAGCVRRRRHATRALVDRVGHRRGTVGRGRGAHLPGHAGLIAGPRHPGLRRPGRPLILRFQTIHARHRINFPGVRRYSRSGENRVRVRGEATSLAPKDRSFALRHQGREIAVEVSGAAHGTPVFLLHGTPGSRKGPKPKAEHALPPRHQADRVRPPGLRGLDPAHRDGPSLTARPMWPPSPTTWASTGSLWSADPAAGRTPWPAPPCCPTGSPGRWCWSVWRTRMPRN